jgi:TonB family protein
MRDSEAASGRAAIFRAWRRALLVILGTVALVGLILVAGRDVPASPQPAEKSPALVTVAAAPLKREPGSRAETVADLKRGDRVTVIADRGAWVEIKAHNVTGYVRAEEIEREEEREAREERAKKILSFPAVYGVVAEETPVLLAPFPFAPEAGKLPKGTGIQIHAVDHAYFAFQDKANGVAFVASADVDLVPPDPKSPDIVRDKAASLRRLSTLDLPTPEPTAISAPLPAPETNVAAGERSPTPPASPRAPVTGGSVEPAVLVSKVDPEYPDLAVRAQVEGSVVLEIGVDETGNVSDVQVTRGLPFGLSEAAAEAVRQWKYRPARGPDGPIPSRKTVRILFTLRSGR